MSSTEPSEHAPGMLAASISKHVVRMFSDYTGRGPTKARTIIRDNVIVTVTHDTLTKGERRLVAEGESDTVVSIRRKFQTAMRNELIDGIKLLTGREVVSFMSDHDAEHDYAAEVFVLDGPPESGADDERVAAGRA